MVIRRAAKNDPQNESMRCPFCCSQEAEEDQNMKNGQNVGDHWDVAGYGINTSPDSKLLSQGPLPGISATSVGDKSGPPSHSFFFLIVFSIKR